MGALTSNRKRAEDYCSFNSKAPSFCSPNSDHVSKKSRLSIPLPQISDKPSSLSSVNFKFYLYPEQKQRFQREVHAPLRAQRFWFPSSSCGISNQRGSGAMGNSCFASRKERKAFHRASQRNLGKRQAIIDVETKTFVKEDESDEVVEVVDVDNNDVVKEDDVVSRDSSMEDIVEILEDEKERKFILSAVSDQRSKEIDDGKVNQLSSSSVVSDLDNVDLKVGDAVMGLGKLSLDQDSDFLPAEPVHKKLLYKAALRDNRLNQLQYQTLLQEQLLESIRLTQPTKKVDEDVASDVFAPLTDDEETEIDDALSYARRRMVLAMHKSSGIEITGQILQCLRPGAWLNDEVINLYLELLKEREKRDPKKYLKCHFFNTFFYKKLIGTGTYSYKAVRRWTSEAKLGYSLHECEKIFVPIHKEIHWTLAVINKKDMKFQYLDSLGGIDKNVIQVLAKYIVDEVKDKNGIDFDVGSWEEEYVEDLPAQENGYDCGMFMIKYVDFYSRDFGLCFSQEHMPYFRRRTAKEILRLKAE